MVEYGDGSTGIVGLSYLPKRRPPTLIETDFTRKALPHTRFYSAKLRTPFHEYSSVDVVVSIRKVGDGLDIRSCVAPDYAVPSGRFLQQFAVASDGSLETRRAVAVGTADLLSRLGEDGSARARRDGPAGQAELWMNGTHIGDIVVTEEIASNQDVIPKVVVVRFRRPSPSSPDFVRSPKLP